jgi:hypothetical protein
MAHDHDGVLPKRPYKDGVQLSIIGFGGNVAVGTKQNEVNRTVDEAVELGVNYSDVAPSMEMERLRRNSVLPCSPIGKGSSWHARLCGEILREPRRNWTDR